MALELITADQRLAEARNKDTVCVLGIYGVGKTSLLHTLDPETTLCLDWEAGMKSVQTWRGDCIQLRSFSDSLALACLVGGPIPGLRDIDNYSEAHYAYVKELYPSLDLSKYRTIFYDSVSDLSISAMQYARAHTPPSKKSGNEDVQGMYGELGRQMVELLRHMQHAPGIDIIFVGRLELAKDDFGREVWQPQIMGGMTSRLLPGIVDHVITMAPFDYDQTQGWLHNPDKGQHRAFVCHKLNPWGLPAKTRTEEHIEMIEEPHLGKFLAKVKRAAVRGGDTLIAGLPNH